MSKTHTDKQYLARYHPIVDNDGWPVANLIILIDRIHKGPSRAELHIDVEAPDYAEEVALREAQGILARQYKTTVAGEGKLELRLMRVEQYRDTTHLDITIVEKDDSHPLWSYTLLMAVVALAMIGIGLGWGLVTLFGSIPDQEGRVPLSVPAVQAETGQLSDSNPQSIDSNGIANGAEQTISSGGVDPSLPQTNDLPPSKNAHNGLVLGQRVRVLPGTALTLRTEPGADSGEGVGYMQDEEQATIVGGPYWVQGDSDTIVWWFVELDDGKAFWAPANDSNLRLLEPMP
ncbi:MAG: hypothetical protein AAF702_26740 [Chloroflexota bacterium]